jgi:hypothetical protein
MVNAETLSIGTNSLKIHVFWIKIPCNNNTIIYFTKAERSAHTYSC